MTEQPFLRKAFWTGIATGCLLISPMVCNIVYARVLGPVGMGRLAYLTWVAGTVMGIAALGLPQTLTRFFCELRTSGQNPAEIYWALLSRYALLTGIGSIGIAFVGCVASSGFHFAADWVFTGAYSLALAAFILSQAQLLGIEDYRSMAKLNAVCGVGQAAAGAIGSVFLGVEGALLGYAAGTLLPICYFAKSQRIPISRRRLNPALRSRMWRYAASVWAGNLVATVIFSRTEIGFLEHFSGPRAVAFFATGLTFASVGTQLPLLINGALIPHFTTAVTQLDDARAHRMYGDCVRLMGLLVLPSSFVLAAVIPTLLPLLYGPKFIGAAGATQALVLLAALPTTATCGTALLYAKEKPIVLLWLGLIGSLMAAAGGFEFVPRWGLTGAVLTRTIVQTFMIVGATWYIFRALHCPTPLVALFKTICASAVSAAVAAAVLSRLTGLAGLSLALCAAGLTYLALVRVSGLITPADKERVLTGMSPLPDALRTAISRIVALLTVQTTSLEHVTAEE